MSASESTRWRRVGAGTRLTDLARGRSLQKSVGRPRMPRVSRSAPTIASFDVFDTLITRPVITPARIWELTAVALAQRDTDAADPDAYVQARGDAERVMAERTRNCATFEDIHLEVARRLGREPTEWVRSALAEIDIERSLSRPVEPGRSLLDSARNAGHRILFVSDMHLPSTAIRELLIGHGLWADGDELWVSAEAGARKKSGELFTLIAATHQIDLRDVEHVGDQPVADRIAPRWLGARSRWITTAVPNRYERILSASDLPDRLGDRLGGPARATRVDHPHSGDPVHDVAVDVAGPTLVAFALWLLAQARDRSLDRLYFLSRDGELIQRVTQVVADALGDPIELRYLYGGRMAWRLPSIDVSADEEWHAFLDDLLLKPTTVTTAGVAQRLGLDQTDVERRLGAKEALDQQARRAARSALSEADVRAEVARYAADQRALATRYLEQERLTDASSCAVVDVGWMGPTMRALAALVPEPPLSLFFAWGGTTDLPGGQDAYLWGGRRRDLWPSMPPVAALIEMFCSGSHGAVRGYRPDGNLVAPDLAGAVSIAAARWPVPRMQESVVAYARAAAPWLRNDDLDHDTRVPVERLLMTLRNHPTRDEANSWGDFPREEDPQGTSVYPIARSFRAGDLPAVVRPGPFAGRNLTWRAAALARSPWHARTLIGGALTARDTARRVTGRR